MDDEDGEERDENADPGADDEEEEEGGDLPDVTTGEIEHPEIHLDELRITQAFIDRLCNATLDGDTLPPGVFKRLQNPPQSEIEIRDLKTRRSLELFIALDNNAEAAYHRVRDSLQRDPEPRELLSLYQVKKLIQEITGVVSVKWDMCPENCMAYTGPWAHLKNCAHCGQSRYDERIFERTGKYVPRKQFDVLPIGPQLQARRRSASSSEAMNYRDNLTEDLLSEFNAHGRFNVLEDFLHSEEYIKLLESGDLKEGDELLMLTIDGAQLYKNKASDCWMWLFESLDMAPNKRYKIANIMMGGLIPGPNKPKNLDSFLYPSLYHVCAIMNEGLPIWDALDRTLYNSNPFLALALADGPGMSYLNGLVGHSGAYGCRLYCPQKSRHKPNVGIYYPVSLRPNGYVSNSDHPDYNIEEIAVTPQRAIRECYDKNLAKVNKSRTDSEYKFHRRETGIAKASIFSGIHRCLPVPSCFPGDIMHLMGINLTRFWADLLIGKADCSATDSIRNWPWAVLTGSTWTTHGKWVAAARRYLPGSFDRPPRNIAEKINSGYKAWEYLLWFYGLCPALLLDILPDEYYEHICLMIRAMSILAQRKILYSDVLEAHRLLIMFVQQYEELYYQRRIDRIHFVRQSIHALVHIARETIRLGPYGIFSQWPMERMIGRLVSELHQHSNPYANLGERFTRRAQINALKALIPDLGMSENQLPRGAFELGNGFVLLHAADSKSTTLHPHEVNALLHFVDTAGIPHDPVWRANPRVKRWARLLLPNSQVARSVMAESKRDPEKIRVARMVKVSTLR